MDFIDYRKKLGIGFDNKELENQFFNRILSVLENSTSIGEEISVQEYYDFCYEIGYYAHTGIYQREVWKNILEIFNSARTIEEFLAYYIFFIKCQNDDNKEYTKKNFINLVTNCLDSSHIPYEVYKDNEDYFIFPKGAEELDNALVSTILLWLEEYPKSHRAFIKAIKSYSKLEDEKISEVADLFRKALETFFKEFFDSSKSLENLKSEYGKYMKEKGVPSGLSNNFETLLKSYTNFMNDYAKHQDRTSKDVLEYIMYQTGNIIRLVITLDNKIED